MAVFGIESTISLVVFFVLLALKIFTFGSALLYPAEAYEAANKLTKPAWCIILGLGIVLTFVWTPLFFINIAFVIAALVYLADVRPALAGLRRR